MSATPALDYLLADEPFPWADIDGTPGECADCPFAADPEDVNPSDEGEGYYSCSLLGSEETDKRSASNRKGKVWGENPVCTPKDWKAKARSERAAPNIEEVDDE